MAVPLSTSPLVVAPEAALRALPGFEACMHKTLGGRADSARNFARVVGAIVHAGRGEFRIPQLATASQGAIPATARELRAVLDTSSWPTFRLRRALVAQAPADAEALVVEARPVENVEDPYDIISLHVRGQTTSAPVGWRKAALSPEPRDGRERDASEAAADAVCELLSTYRKDCSAVGRPDQELPLLTTGPAFADDARLRTKVGQLCPEYFMEVSESVAQLVIARSPYDHQGPLTTLRQAMMAPTGQLVTEPRQVRGRSRHDAEYVLAFDAAAPRFGVGRPVIGGDLLVPLGHRPQRRVTQLGALAARSGSWQTADAVGIAGFVHGHALGWERAALLAGALSAFMQGLFSPEVAGLAVTS